MRTRKRFHRSRHEQPAPAGLPGTLLPGTTASCLPAPRSRRGAFGRTSRAERRLRRCPAFVRPVGIEFGRAVLPASAPLAEGLLPPRGATFAEGHLRPVHAPSGQSLSSRVPLPARDAHRTPGRHEMTAQTGGDVLGDLRVRRPPPSPVHHDVPAVGRPLRLRRIHLPHAAPHTCGDRSETPGDVLLGSRLRGSCRRCAVRREHQPGCPAADSVQSWRGTRHQCGHRGRP